MSTKIVLLIVGVLNFVYMGMSPEMSTYDMVHLAIGAVIAGLVGYLDDADAKKLGVKK